MPYGCSGTLDINADYDSMTVKELREILKAECVCAGLSKMKKDELLRIIYDLLNMKLSAGDKKLIRDFEGICTMYGAKRCRIVRPNGSFLYHDY